MKTHLFTDGGMRCHRSLHCSQENSRTGMQSSERHPSITKISGCDTFDQTRQDKIVQRVYVWSSALRVLGVNVKRTGVVSKSSNTRYSLTEHACGRPSLERPRDCNDEVALEVHQRSAGPRLGYPMRLCELHHNARVARSRQRSTGHKTFLNADTSHFYSQPYVSFSSFLVSICC
ncbi:hypothetical protein BaRGS_00008134 [Batillaria attramentaria]|uniref:Uncharacterized protein n=1 Tax=Batillaria attramentaria TaxID=370345 RepID=A0ABD0LNG6_9CAEN